MGSYIQVGLEHAGEIARVEICGRCGARKTNARDHAFLPLASRVRRFPTLKVTKEEFVRLVEAEFDLADDDKDGQLNAGEFEHFLHSLSHPHRGP
jgi:hypothetical protein